MFIYTEADTVINTDNVAYFKIEKNLGRFDIVAHFTSTTVDGLHGCIKDYSTLKEAQEVMDKIFLCLDANRSLDMRETEGKG